MFTENVYKWQFVLSALHGKLDFIMFYTHDFKIQAFFKHAIVKKREKLLKHTNSI